MTLFIMDIFMEGSNELRWYTISNHGSCSNFVSKSWMNCGGILFPISIMSIIFQDFRPQFFKIFIIVWEKELVKSWLKMNQQIILVKQIPHVEVMKNSPIRYPKSKRCFPWLVRVRMNGKKMVVMLFKVIMEDSDNSFGFGFKGQVFYLVFYI